jgi:simple sugar transport system ATP-binding protein
MVHQHFQLVPSFTVAENVMLGRELSRSGLLDRETEKRAVVELAEKHGLPVDPDVQIRDLPVGIQQRVEILKLLHRQARILILDEPTAVLTPQAARELMQICRSFTEEGRSVIFITHKLLEVMEVADRVTVMRKGAVVGTRDVRDTSVEELARMMVGRDVVYQVRSEGGQVGELMLDVQDLLVAGAGGVPAVLGVSLQARAGEILGIAGVSGNGQTELVEALTGLRTVEGGSIHLFGEDITRSPVSERRNAGMAHIPEDRLQMGLSVDATLDENLLITCYRDQLYSNGIMLKPSAVQEMAQETIDRFEIVAAKVGEGISALSGGNLQRVVLGRELNGLPKLIVANQPTRGLDVGSIEFVHRLLLDARTRGAAVLLVSVELDEIMRLSDRILVLFRGSIAGEVSGKSATEEELGLLMAGVTQPASAKRAGL